MKKSLVAVVGVLAIAVVAAGQDLALWNINDAREATRLEIQVDEAGQFVEVEYHMDPARVPPVIQEAMRREFPGVGAFTDAEKERDGGVLYYELSGEVGGLEVEAMFDLEGRLHSKEVEVPQESVPANVQQAVLKSAYVGTVTKWEEIRGSDGELVEYHVKTEHEGRKYKVIVPLAGIIGRVYLETVAEIEVPIR